LEPLATPAQNLAVQLAVDESGEVHDVGPDRHVDDDPGGTSGVPDEGVDAGGVAALLLKAPAEARGAVGGGVDRVEQARESPPVEVIDRFDYRPRDEGVCRGTLSRGIPPGVS